MWCLRSPYSGHTELLTWPRPASVRAAPATGGQDQPPAAATASPSGPIRGQETGGELSLVERVTEREGGWWWSGLASASHFSRGIIKTRKPEKTDWRTQLITSYTGTALTENSQRSGNTRGPEEPSWPPADVPECVSSRSWSNEERKWKLCPGDYNNYLVDYDEQKLWSL